MLRPPPPPEPGNLSFDFKEKVFMGKNGKPTVIVKPFLL